jgi:P27 family predicted phage terminase small subunit
MGKRGPAKTPTALLKLSGTHRYDARIKQGEPAPPPLESVPILESMGVMSNADIDALAMYCQSLAKLEEYEKFIEENGSTYTTLNAVGDISAIRPYPQATMAKEMTATVSRLGQQFGLTPSSRAHLEVSDPDKQLKNDKNQFFRATANKTA